MDPELSRNLERYREFFARAESSFEYWNEAATYEFVQEIERRMAAQGVSRAELARRLGTSKAYVTKILSIHTNFTLATMNRLAAALGGAVRFQIVDPETAGEQPPEDKAARPLRRTNKLQRPDDR